MTDIERLLTEAFQQEGESFEPDVHKARHAFLQRRRKRRIGIAFSGVAVAGAAVAAAVFVASSVPSPMREDEIDLASAIPTIVASAPVAGAPEAAAVVSDGVWVANAEPGKVNKIDPATNEVVASVPLEGSTGTPDEIVAVGSYAAVTTTDGYIHLFDSVTGDPVYSARRPANPISMDIDGPTAAARPSDTFRLDLDVSGDTVWVANENNGFIYGLFNAGDGGEDFTGEPVEDIAPNDIAVGDGRVFGLDSDRGLVAVFEITGEPGPPKLERIPGTIKVPSGDYLDMRYGFGKLWISDESGRVFAFDPEDGGGLSTTQVGGRYTDLVIDEDSVWALPGGDEEGGRLVAIDPEDGTVRNEGIAIEGNPVDVVTGLGSLWVVDKDGAAEGAAGSLLRVDPTGVGTPSPDAEPTETDEPAEETPSEGAQVVFAYSAGGEIYTEYEDGATVQLTLSHDEESNPEFDLNSILFERHDNETDWFGIIEHDLLTGEEQIVVEMGAHPAVSPGGDLAWVDTAGDGQVMINIAPALDDGYDPNRGYSFPAGDAYTEARALEWSDDAKTLYYQAKGEGWVTIQAQIPAEFNEAAPSKIDPFVLNGTNDQPPGATLIQPDNATADHIQVANVCCSTVEGDPYSQVTVGRISFTEGGATYSELTEPLELPEPNPDTIEMFQMHELTYTDGTWDAFGGSASWIVHSAGNVWLLNEAGEVLHLGGPDGEDVLGAGHDPGFSGFTINPTLEGY